MGIVFESDADGPKARAVGTWTPDDARALWQSRIRRFEVGSGYGDLSFPFKEGLDRVDELKVNHLALRSDGDVAALSNLRTLSLETYSNDRIDIARSFPKLERLAFNWRPGGETAFEATTLMSLRISGYPRADLTPLARLDRLYALRISNSARLSTLSGVESLRSLRILSLRDDRGVTDIGAMTTMEQSLFEFELNGCRKVTAISALARHTELRRVMLIDCGRIASLAPLADLPELVEFWFYGTTVIEDGDMTPLLAMPALKRVSYAPRRHYTHRFEEIERLRGLTESDPLPHWRW